jgi:hypothetical protein
MKTQPFAIAVSLIVGAVAAPACVDSKLTFVCDATHTCGQGGTCVDSACAFVDSTCQNGLRFDSSAEGERRGQCVDVVVILDMSVLLGDAAFDAAGTDTAPGPDLQPPPPDLSEQDLVPPPPDLVPPPDLTGCVPTGAEDCYNGEDDDCDGQEDCADSDCTTDNECVPETPGFEHGTLVAPNQSCPSGFSASLTDIHRGLDDRDGSCMGCSCSATLKCATTIYDFATVTCNSTNTPGGGSWDIEGISTGANTCTTGPPSTSAGTMNITSGKIRVGNMSPTSTCPASGTPGKPPLAWASDTRFCETSFAGGGCVPGSVCVPKTASKHCALAENAVTCPQGYSPEGGMSWYTGADDSARSCGGVCTCNTTAAGACGTSKARLGINNQTCADPASELNAGSNNCLLNTTGFRSATVRLEGHTIPTCAVSNQITGNAIPTGEHTLCCR